MEDRGWRIEDRERRRDNYPKPATSDQKTEANSE
jgi:hypothetical protein